MMGKRSDNRNSDVAPHLCGPLCLGPLTFHARAAGDLVRLSRGCRYAERTGDSFRNGLAFSSRPVRVQEVVRLRLGRSTPKWHGALRLGFTTVPPSARALPLPAMAIPDLTDAPGHWAAPVHESCCRPGAELRFWVCHSGSVHVRGGGGGGRLKLLTGVDLSRPLWAVVDIYGQTGSVYLLGSEKKWAFWTKRSCPAPDVDNCCSLIPDVPGLCGDGGKCISRLDLEVPADGGSSVDCVVCYEKEARITLPCGHRCLCNLCASRVIQEFGTCPLCRTDLHQWS